MPQHAERRPPRDGTPPPSEPPAPSPRSATTPPHQPAPAPPRPWHTLPVEEAEAVLGSGAEGLAASEAADRLERYGPNEIEAEREKRWWELAIHQFRDPLIYILLIAAAVTLVLREYADAGVILAVVLINAVIGFVQERRAQQAMQALARMSAPRAEVVREGEPREVPSAELVPGDVVMLTSGTRVPADLRLLRVRDMEADESALTGESVPVRKASEALDSETLVSGDQRNMAFAGTVVTRGRARGLVVRTGTATEIGRIARAVREIGQTTTPLQETMHRFGRLIGVAILVLSVLVVGLGLLVGMPAGEIFMAAVATAVASIPEGLPVVLTVTLAIGVGRMARRNAIIRSLPAVETLGSTTVIGSDKTGTLKPTR